MAGRNVFGYQEKKQVDWYHDFMILTKSATETLINVRLHMDIKISQQTIHVCQFRTKMSLMMLHCAI